MSEQHNTVLDAFRSIDDKNALAWSVLDTKSELFVSAAIALSANRRARRRIAHVEYPPRVDLVLVDEQGRPAHAYLAKAGYLTDFQPARIQRRDPYLGLCLDDDIPKVQGLCTQLGPSVRGSALFYLYEVSAPSRQLKYGKVPPVSLSVARETLPLFVPRASLIAHETIDCGHADGADVRIHLYVFEPTASDAGAARAQPQRA
jgi:hypothetical protein